MKIFITGIESFVGTNLTKILKKKGYKVIGIDKNKKKNSTKKFNITDKNIYKIIPKNCDCLIHLAAVSSTNSFKKNLPYSFNVNVNGTFNVMQGAIKKNVKQIIFASTEWVYGEDKLSKIKTENSNISLKKISSDYTLSKVLGEQMIEYYSLKNGIDCTILRFGIIYGPRISNKNFSAVERILQNMINKKKLIVGSKKTARRFIYVTDLCEAIYKSIGLKGIKKFNITGDKLINLEKIYKEGNKALNIKSSLTESNKKNYNIRNINNKNFKKYTKWKPKVEINEGINNVILSLKKNI